METKELFKTEFLSWDDVSHLGEVERIATILDNGRIKPSKYSEEKQNLILSIQLEKNFEIFDFRMNKRTWRKFKEVWGTDSNNWRGKQVNIVPFVYGDGKQSVELIPIKELRPFSPKTIKENDHELLKDYLEKVKKAYMDKLSDE